MCRHEVSKRLDDHRERKVKFKMGSHFRPPVAPTVRAVTKTLADKQR